jgi:hypothetical protein
LRLVADVASAVENALAAYSDTTVTPHEYFDQTGWRLLSASTRATFSSAGWLTMATGWII